MVDLPRKRKKKRKQSEPGLHLNWQPGDVLHFVVETKQGPVHFGIRMTRSPRKGITLLQGADKRVRWVPKE